MNKEPINTGGAAFPLNNFTYPNGETEIGFNGMTLRDYFAAKAMNGMITQILSDGARQRKDADAVAAVLAHASYAIADAMIKEGSKP